MVSRKNLLEKIHKIEEKHEHHSIRKFTFGAASVLIGLTFMGSNSRPVKASKLKKNESEIVLVENQGTESEATEQNIINQYTTNSENEKVVTDNQSTDTIDNLNSQSVSDQTQEGTSSSSNQVTNEKTPSKDSQIETKQPTYQESQNKVNDINNSINNDLKDKVDEASKVDGVTVKEEDPNKIATGTTDIDKNADKIKEDNQKQIEKIEKQLADHKAKLEIYKNDLAKYEAELAKYTQLRNDYIAKLKELGLWKEGDVDPSDISQDLVLGKEENAAVDVVISDNHTGSVTKGDGTILKDENGNPLLMHQYLVKDSISGEFLTVIYTNLENSTYNGEAIGKIEVVYSDFTISNNSYQGNSQAGIYFGKSPTDGFFYRKADGVTIELKMYNKNGNRINLKDNTAYVTVGSLNNGSSSTSHKEYIEKAEIINGDGHKGEGVALPESSVTIHHGPNGDILYADKDNEVLHDSQLTAKDKKLAISLWGEDIVNRYLNWDDSKDRSKEIFGAGLFKVSGNSIKIRFSNELGSAWATFSTTVPKLAFEGEKPIEPTKPTTVINWHPGELVLNKNSNVHIHYIDVHEEAKNGITDFDHVGLGHGFELKDQLQSHTHLSIGERYHNQLWAWADAGYMLATDTHHPDAESGTVLEDDKHVYVYLKRQTAEDTRKKEVNQVIHYVYENGTTAAPDHDSQTLIFEQTGIKDLVTGETDWNGEWTLTQSFVTVVSPTIQGYHTDRPEVGPYDITVDNSNFDQNLDKEDTVVYVANPTETVSRDKEVNQIIHYVYEDGTTAAPDHVSVKLIFTQTGVKDLITGETVWDGEWTETQSFVTITSPTITGYHTDRPEVGPYDITVDNSNFDQNLDKEDTVVYKANPTETVSRDKEVNQIIHYVYEDGTTAAPDHVSIKLVFTQTGVKDLITGETVWDGEWKQTQSFVTVVSPTIDGYTADRVEVGPYDITVDNNNFDENLDKEDTVVYIKNPEQPTQPSEPTNPTTPEDQPTVPEDQPTNPTQPSTPEEQPTNPTQPSTPEEQPTNPTTPEDQPTNPTQPSTPSEEPTNPTIPDEAVPVPVLPEEIPSDSEEVTEEETVMPKPEKVKDSEDNTPNKIATVLPKAEKATLTKLNVSEVKKTAAKNLGEKTSVALPETGEEQTNKAGVFGLAIASIASLLGLAGAKKRKKN